MSETTVPVIRKDAQVQITIGTNFIKQLQDASLFMLLSKTETEIDDFQKELNEGKLEFEQPWKTHYITMMSLLRGIDIAAEEQGFVDQVPQDQAPSQLDS
jgi:hypothetical protein